MTTILETKLRRPRPRAAAVPRARLVDRLAGSGDSRLVLVSAPPGFGKTTLVEQWIATLPPDAARVAWLSLDASDDEPGIFWAYVTAAIATVAPEAAAGAQVLLEGGATRADLVVPALLNGLASADTGLVLVLDDLHVIDRREIHEGLAFLVDHLPHGVRVVVLTRSDPPLPLARMRVRGDLVEVRSADLRFTPDEAAAYLNGQMGFGLAEADVAALDARTEGWIAALQLAALSLQGRGDQAAFIAEFAGDDRYVVDYLADEVLERQPDEVRTFLLETSILDRLTGPLCDAVTGGPAGDAPGAATGVATGAATLEALERANLFLVPLDDRRRWYRYHHLFADLLRARLRDQRPDDVAGLHRRASAWWEANGEPAQAIGHALAGGDVERAADMIELAAHELRAARQEATLRRWLDSLPDALFERRPILAIAHVGALLSTGEAAGVDARLTAAERWLPAAAGGEARAAAEAAGMVVRHPVALDHLPGAIALYRAALAQMRGDLPATIRYAQTALDAASEDQPLERGAASGLLALAMWANGDLETAYATWGNALGDLDRAGHRADMLGGFMAMAEIAAAQGRLQAARRMYELGLRHATTPSPPLRGIADMHVGLAALHLEWNDLEAARSHLDTAATLGDALGLPQNPYRRRVALAGLHAAAGDVPGALDQLDEAERVYEPDMFPPIRPIAAVRARLWVRIGRHADALAWAAERGLTTGDDLTYLRECEHMTLARALVADATASGSRARADDAGTFIDRLLAAAVEGDRGGSVIELRALRGIADALGGDRAAGADQVTRALLAAEGEGYVRLFVDMGPEMALLLADIARRTAVPAYAKRLLAVVAAPPAIAGRAHGLPAGHPARPGSQPLVEPLSERELEVLRLLASDLDGPEIAAQLFVSVNTLRTHTKNIFAKLGVNSRRAAVTRATELGILARG